MYGRCVVDGHVLLTRLADGEPDAGRWTLPGGGMEFGESPHDTLRREFVEETSLDPEIGPLLGARSQVSPPTAGRGPLQTVQLVYSVRASGTPEVLEVDGSTDAVAWYPLDEAVTTPLVPVAWWALAG